MFFVMLQLCYYSPGPIGKFSLNYMILDMYVWIDGHHNHYFVVFKKAFNSDQSKKFGNWLARNGNTIGWTMHTQSLWHTCILIDAALTGSIKPHLI